MEKIFYLDQPSKVFSAEESEKLLSLGENLFGRNKISNTLLNAIGTDSHTKILNKIKENYPHIDYNPILPRIVQLLLWYVPEKPAYEMLVILIEFHCKNEEENTIKPENADIVFFTTNIKTLKVLVDHPLTLLKIHNKRKLAKQIIKQMIIEMFVSIIPYHVIIT